MVFLMRNESFLTMVLYWAHSRNDNQPLLTVLNTLKSSLMVIIKSWTSHKLHNYARFTPQLLFDFTVSNPAEVSISIWVQWQQNPEIQGSQFESFIDMLSTIRPCWKTYRSIQYLTKDTLADFPVSNNVYRRDYASDMRTVLLLRSSECLRSFSGLQFTFGFLVESTPNFLSNPTNIHSEKKWLRKIFTLGILSGFIKNKFRKVHRKKMLKGFFRMILEIMPIKFL